MNAKIVFLAIGVVAGGALGFAAGPSPVETKASQVATEVHSDGAESVRSGRGVTTGQWMKIAALALAGAALGLAGGALADRRRI